MELAENLSQNVSAKYSLSVSHDSQETIITIILRENGEDCFYETHFPIKGVGLVKSEKNPPEPIGFFPTEKIVELYEKFLKEGCSYNELISTSLRKIAEKYKYKP